MSEKNKLSEQRKKELYSMFLLVNIYPNIDMMPIKEYRELLEELKLEVLSVKDKETEENTKEIFERIRNLKKCVAPGPENLYFTGNNDEIINYFRENLSEDFYFLPYHLVKENFKNLTSSYSISHSAKYGIFEAASSIILPETEFMEDALVSYFILEEMEKESKYIFKMAEKNYNRDRMRNYYIKNAIFSCVIFMEGILNNMLYDYYNQVNKKTSILTKKELNYCKKGSGDFDQKLKILKKIKPEFKNIEKENIFIDFQKIKNKRNLLIHFSPKNAKAKDINNFNELMKIILEGIKGTIELAKFMMSKIETRDCLLYHNFEYSEYEEVAKKFLGLDEIIK